MGFNLLKIKELIIQKRITQQEFADAIGVTKQTIVNYLSERTRIEANKLGDIAEFFNVSVSYFYEENEPEVREPRETYSKKPKKYIEERIEELEARINKLENKL